MSISLSALQNFLLKELESLNTPSLRPSHSSSWNSIFQEELNKMNGMPVSSASGQVSQTLQPNNTTPAILSRVSQHQTSARVNLNTFWNDSQIHAYNQSGHAESSADAVTQDLAVASQDAQKVPQSQYAVYGQIPVGHTVLSGYDGKSFYITNVNGTLFRSAVPVAISPELAK